jgi:hypothetical protein
MAITELSRAQLNQEFRDGERPSGDDFASAWLSFLHKSDDGVKLDVNSNLELNRGLTLKDTPAGQAGTLRFNSGQLQYHDGTSFKSVSTGSSGAFLPVAGGPSVAFGGGNVGIGTFATAPTHRLEINLGNNTAADQRVKFGNLVFHNGSTGDAGYISNAAKTGNLDYALRQDSQGNTTINTANNTQLIFAQNGAARIRVLVSGAIELTPVTTVTIAGDTAIGTSPVHKNLTVFGNLTVSGTINGTIIPPSDFRLKKDILPFSEGFQKVLSLNPVKFKYNGKADTPNDDREYVGFIAQDLQKVYPELIVPRLKKLNDTDLQETELLSYDPGPLTFVLINAIKEIAVRLDNLEKKPNEKRKSKSSAGANN